MSRNQVLWVAVAAVLVALAAGWMLGRAWNDEAGVAADGEPVRAERKVLYYRNPMGLPDTSPVPKKDPMGMDYIPVYAGDEPPAGGGDVAVSPGRIQTMGVRTEPARHAPLATAVRASGTVAIDETREYVVAPRFEGWVERLYVNQTGMQVRAGQPLLSVYSPELAAARQEYRLADAAARRLAGSDPASAASMERLRDAARLRLRNWGVDGTLLADPGAGADAGMVLRSPADAVVIDKPIVQGARFQPGEAILRLADLSTVWILARVPAMQAVDIAVGDAARFQSDTLPGRSYEGKVAFVQPVVDAATRTIEVRIALLNPAGELRPGLFGTVELELSSQQTVLSVPRSAVLDGGTSQTVLVQTGLGRFAPREVTIGRRAGERVEILEGLAAGEEVVVSANFLIDAESRIKAALEGFGAASDDPHAGHAMPAKDDPHAGHAMPVEDDPHAGHAMPADDPHEGH